MPSAAAHGTLSFTRCEVTATSTTSPRCLLVYPLTRKSKQRVAVGDNTGVFSVFSVGRNNERVEVFSTEGDSNATAAGSSSGTGVDHATSKKPISCATLFGDQLFFMQGSTLSAYSRKGKHFFNVDTNATEVIHSVYIDTPFVFVAGNFMVTSLRETKELGFFMSPDRVHAMTVFPVEAALARTERELQDYICCLGCNDRVLRLVRNNQLLDESSTEAPVTALFFAATTRRVFYATQAGSVGAFVVQSNNSLRRCLRYSVVDRTMTSPVTCMTLFDVNLDGEDEVLLGCEDGSVHVLAIVAAPGARTLEGGGSAAETSLALELLWSGSAGERVMSIAAGAVTIGAAQPDILVHLFSGRVLAFTLQPEELTAALPTATGPSLALQQQREEMAVTRASLTREIAQLKEKVASRSHELANATGAAKQRAPLVAVASTFNADVVLRAVDKTAQLALVINSDVPLECALFRSTAALQFMGTEGTQVSEQLDPATRSAGDVVGGGVRRGSLGSMKIDGGFGKSGVVPPNRTRTLAIARSLRDDGGGQDAVSENGLGGNAAAGGKRLEVTLWADEGHTDTISIVLFSTIAPRTAQVKTMLLCALPLYSRVASIHDVLPASEAPFALSQVTFSGAFNGQDVQSWLCQLFPDVSPVYQPTLHTYYYACDFIRSVVIVEVEQHTRQKEGAGKATEECTVLFTSDSLSALAAIKRCVGSALAARTATQFTTTENVLFGSVAYRLKLLQPAIQTCTDALKRAQLLEALRELQGSESDLNFLPQHLLSILHTPDKVETEGQVQQHQKQYLKRTLVRLYKSMEGFLHHCPPLTGALQSHLEAMAAGKGYSPEKMEELFFPRSEHVEERERLVRELAANEAAAAAAAAKVNASTSVRCEDPPPSVLGGEDPVLSSPTLSGASSAEV